MSTSAVGLDIGRTAVRAVELRGGSRRPVVKHAGRVPLELGAVEGGLVKDPAAVTQALKTLWKESKISSRDVRLGVCSGSVLVRQIELDWMPQADLRRALRYQVADLLPVSVDDANLDHVYLGEHERVDPATGKSSRMVRILLVATARGGVDDLVRCVSAAGLRPITADLSPLALVRAAARAAAAVSEDDDLDLPDSPSTPTEAVIDIGADKIAVAVHTGGIPHFVRVAPGLGGETFTRAVVERTGATWAAAEQAKTGQAGEDRTLERDTAQVVAAATERLLSDIRTTLDFHAGTDPSHVPTRAVITGGGSAHPAFVDQCARHLGIPVHRLDPSAVAHLRRSGGRNDDELDDPPPGTLRDSDLLVPIGLCLGETA